MRVRRGGGRVCGCACVWRGEQSVCVREAGEVSRGGCACVWKGGGCACVCEVWVCVRQTGEVSGGGCAWGGNVGVCERRGCPCV